MLTIGLALIALPAAAIIAEVLTVPFHLINKKFQWAGRSAEDWRAQSVESPGERLPALSFVLGGLCTTVTRSVGIFAAGSVFHWRGAEMPLVFLIVVGVLLLVNDVFRVLRFVGSSGVWTELGYGAGGLAGLGLGFFLVITYLSG